MPGAAWASLARTQEASRGERTPCVTRRRAPEELALSARTAPFGRWRRPHAAPGHASRHGGPGPVTRRELRRGGTDCASALFEGPGRDERNPRSAPGPPLPPQGGFPV